jgi:D-alanyl-D-alanine carboxypeptidase
MHPIRSWLPKLTYGLAMGLLSAAAFASDAPATHESVEHTVSSILEQSYAPDGPGASVIVVKDGKVLFRGARGMANVELGSPLQPQSVFRIGSVTKQFTGAAILLLAHEGKLSLSDPLTKFIPDFPTQGHNVTVQHLLSHTSGIKNYTEIPEWAPTMRMDLTVDQLINVFKDKPFDFAPGEQWKYDNSGYVLLGSIIERVSGQSYADFMRTRIFDPLGMKQTRVDVSVDIVADRAEGYAKQGDHWVNADFLSMTQPYSAGDLISSVDDLARWNAAIENNEILTQELWKRATTSFALADGAPTQYGAGWFMGRVGNLASVEHGGGINGFNAYVLRVPSKHLYVAVLANAAPPSTPAQQLALNLAASALGISLDTPEAPVSQKILNQYVGNYAVEPSKTRRITLVGNRLHAMIEGDKDLELTPIGRDLFEARDDHSHFHFIRLSGRVDALSIEPRFLMGDRIPAKRVSH